MTTTQLIEILSEYPPDAQVVARWECGWSKLDKPPSLVSDRKGRMVVEFDVEEWGTYDNDEPNLKP